VAILTEAIKKAIGNMGVFPIATASATGVPNLVYVGCLRVLDNDTIQIADNKFCKTRQNLDENPVLTVTLWYPDCERCYQLKGNVTLITEGDVYDDCVEWVHGAINADLTPKAAVNLIVTEVYSGSERLA